MRRFASFALGVVAGVAAVLAFAAWAVMREGPLAPLNGPDAPHLRWEKRA